MNAPIPTSDRAGDARADLFLDVSGTYGHIPGLEHLRPLIVRVNPHTYISANGGDDPLSVTWLDLALTGMEALRRTIARPVVRVAVIGTGCGLDVIGISHLFHPEEVIASDIHLGTLDAARTNIDRYKWPATRCRVIQSDLLRNYPRESGFDLIYENLPNIPEGADLLDGIRAASCFDPASYRSDPVSDHALLTLHHNCLLEARDHLSPGGWIVSMIGGRISWRTIEEMFGRAGYSAEILHFGLKTQTEQSVVVDGYARAERNGSSPFIFYHPVAACGEILARHRSAAGAHGTVEAEAVVADLEPYRISADAALRLCRKGEKVCHTVYVVGGSVPASRGQSA